jgi:hypothetical protein
MAKMTRSRLHEALNHAERHIAADTEQIEKQRRVIERLEARGDRITGAAARVVLATMERAQQGHIANRERTKRLLAR